MSEEFYDQEIAPKLKELAETCGARGLSFLAVVEYAPEECATTRLLRADAGLKMAMLSMCAHHGVNVDGYMINLIRHLRSNGIDWGQSMVLRQLAGTSAGKTDRNSNEGDWK